MKKTIAVLLAVTTVALLKVLQILGYFSQKEMVAYTIGGVFALVIAYHAKRLTIRALRPWVDELAAEKFRRRHGAFADDVTEMWIRLRTATPNDLRLVGELNARHFNALVSLEYQGAALQRVALQRGIVASQPPPLRTMGGHVVELKLGQPKPA